MSPVIVTLAPGADPAAVRRALVARGLWVDAALGPARAALAFVVQPGSAATAPAELAAIPGVAAVAATASPHPRADAHPRVVLLREGLAVGRGRAPVLMAGPCCVETEDGIHAIAARVAAAGGKVLRGGAWKPRTSPHAFQGHGERALGWLADAARAHGLACVSEVLSERDVELAAATVDLIQVGSRSMQSFALLREVGRAGRPVLLKRGMAATVEEWLLAAEHLLVAGAPGVILCERGLRGFDPSTRNCLDLGAVALIAHGHRLPVIVDPSHAAGRRDLVPALALAGVAAGAHGLLVETHPEPGDALCDGPQALPIAGLAPLARALTRVAAAREDAP